MNAINIERFNAHGAHLGLTEIDQGWAATWPVTNRVIASWTIQQVRGGIDMQWAIGQHRGKTSVTIGQFTDMTIADINTICDRIKSGARKYDQLFEQIGSELTNVDQFIERKYR